MLSFKRNCRIIGRIIIGHLKYILCFVLLFCLWSPIDSLAEKADVLMYIVGSDMETAYASATNDLYEVLHISEAYPNKQIFAFLCGSKTWWLPQINGDSCYLIRINAGKFDVLCDYGPQNGTTYEQLSAFIASYGEDGSDLIFWGHGLPGISGIGYDQNNRQDSLSLYEIHEALASAGIRFRMIGFDACRMASIQAVLVIKQNADFFALQ